MNAPVASPAVAKAVIDPQSYADWDPLLDLFDQVRAETPVLRIESPDDDHEPFWLITRYDDVMRISKDNATFLNAPRPVVFTNRQGEQFARHITAQQGDESPNLVNSLVALDALRHRGDGDGLGLRRRFRRGRTGLARTQAGNLRRGSQGPQQDQAQDSTQHGHGRTPVQGCRGLRGRGSSRIAAR